MFNEMVVKNCLVPSFILSPLSLERVLFKVPSLMHLLKEIIEVEEGSGTRCNARD